MAHNDNDDDDDVCKNRDRVLSKVISSFGVSFFFLNTY
jgi:hypothetical protein